MRGVGLPKGVNDFEGRVLALMTIHGNTYYDDKQVGTDEENE